MVVLKKIIFTIILIILFVCNISYASRILDYETEIFIQKLIDQIKYENKISTNLKFVIVANNNINAYVDENNLIHITSGLIVNCNDYIALLSVIAHEIGHIDKNHIHQRKLNINKLQDLNAISSLSIIAGSLLSNNPEILQGLALSSAGTSNYFIKFSKDQEREADYYALKTLESLEVYSDSIVDLLETIEAKSSSSGLTKEKIKISTHPYFEERIELVNYLKRSEGERFDKNLNKKFKFIKAKFIGYNGNTEYINKLNGNYKLYATSIYNSKKGNLKQSMKEINQLISNNDNVFLLETKADILFSHGFINESIKFYDRVLQEYPDNNYARIRIFQNTYYNNFTIQQYEKIFLENINLLESFLYNEKIVTKFLELSRNLNYKEWVSFLEFWLYNKEDPNKVKQNLDKYKNTEDKNLLNLINIITRAYS